MKLFKNPYVIASITFIILVVAVLSMVVNSSNPTTELYVSSLLGVITIYLSSLLLINAYQQNQISKRNMKLQLFDKRYKVFEVIASSTRVISERNYSNQILTIGINDPNFINKKIVDGVEKMHDAAILAQTLFDKSLSDKIFEASRKYNDLSNIHFTILKQSIELSTNPEFIAIFKTQLFSTDENEMVQLDLQFKEKFPQFVRHRDYFNTEINHYHEWIKESGIEKDFDEYLMIDKLDQI